MSEALTALKSELASLAATFKTPARLEFAKGLAAGKSQEQAYVDAGYKSKNPAVDASKAIAAYPSITQYKELFLRIAQLEALPKQIASREQKRNMLWEIAQRCVQEIEPEYEGYGEDREMVGFTFNAKGAVSAISELNKMDGDLATIKTENKHTHSFDELTEEQLNDRIAELSRKAGAGVST